MLEEVLHYSALEQRILDRYDQANRNPFTPTRPYIPENANLGQPDLVPTMDLSRLMMRSWN